MITISLENKTVTIQCDIETACSIERICGVFERAQKKEFSFAPDNTRWTDFRTKLRNVLALVSKY